MKQQGVSRNPFFHFGLGSFILFALLISSAGSLASLGVNTDSKSVFLNTSYANTTGGNDLFLAQNKANSLETPDLKIVSDSFVAAITVPNIVDHQTLGMIFGEDSNEHGDASKIREYEIQGGDTIESIAQHFNVSADTIILANNLSKTTPLETGETLTILPVSGLIHIVKSGDTISGLSKAYKVKSEDIISFNTLSGEGDIFVGDTLIIPGGLIPEKTAPLGTPSFLADGFFGNPTIGKVTQRLHYYNAVDVANSCGTPIYAAASGTVQRAVANGAWNGGKGNYATILHSNGVVTYYGHFSKLYVSAGDKVAAGDTIGLMGDVGNTTGCNLHFQALGSKNPLAAYVLGAWLK